MSAACLWAPFVLASLVASKKSGEDYVEVVLRGTLTLSGPGSAIGIEASRGFSLFATAVNAKRVFRLSDGRWLKVRFDIDDDLGNEFVVREKYHAMANDDASPFGPMLIGPSSLGLSEVAAQVVTKAWGEMTWKPGAIVLLRPADVVRSDSITHTERVFKVVSPSDDQFETAFRVLYAQGARSLAVGWGHTPGNRAACSEATRVAQKLGIEVVANLSVGVETTRVEEMRKMSAIALHSPDVFIGCFSDVDAFNIVLYSRVVGFSPKAMILTSAMSRSFWNTVGAPNANYIIGTSDWFPTPGTESFVCRVFDSPAGFLRMYSKTYGDADGMGVAAAAAAAGFAFLAALEAYPLGVAEALSRLQAPSFFGTLSFDAGGMLTGACCKSVLQLQPHSVGPTGDPIQVHLKSDVVPIGESLRPPLWPMPAWEKKDVECNPCKPGYQLKDCIPGERTCSAPVFCEACPVGRYRPDKELGCHVCPDGLYTALTGQAQCTPCPVGASCKRNPYSWKQQRYPDASEGYYLLPEAPLGLPIYARCVPPSVCLGANECDRTHEGILCRRCKPGFVNSVFVKSMSHTDCQECSSDAVNILTLVVVVLGFGFYLIVIVVVHIGTSMLYRPLTSIVMKKALTYMHIVYSISAATKVNVWAMFASPMKFLRFLQLPTYSIQTSMECVLTGHAFPGPTFALAAVFLILVVPIVMGMYVARAMEPKARIAELSMQYAEQGVKQDAVSRMSQVSGGRLINLAYQGMRKSDVIDKKDRVQLTQWAVIYIFVLHPIVFNTLFKCVLCEQMDVQRLTADLDMVCGNMTMRLLVARIGLIGWGIGVPLVLFALLFKVRHQLHDPAIMTSYGFLYDGYDSRHYYFEIVHIARNIVIQLASALPIYRIRIVALLFLTIFFLALHIGYWPHDNRCFMLLNKLEFTSLASIIFMLFAAAIADIVRDDASGSEIVAYTSQLIILMLITVAFHVAFWAMSIGSIVRAMMIMVARRNAVLGQKPERYAIPNIILTDLLVYSLDYASMDIRRLRLTEVRFLHVALCDTLEHYFNSGAPFSATYLASAVSEAVIEIVRERVDQARFLIELNAVKEKTFSDRLILWLGLLTPKKSKTRQLTDNYLVLAGMPVSVFWKAVTVEDLQSQLMFVSSDIANKSPKFWFSPFENRVLRLLNMIGSAETSPGEEAIFVRSTLPSRLEDNASDIGCVSHQPTIAEIRRTVDENTNMVLQEHRKWKSHHMAAFDTLYAGDVDDGAMNDEKAAIDESDLQILGNEVGAEAPMDATQEVLHSESCDAMPQIDLRICPACSKNLCSWYEVCAACIPDNEGDEEELRPGVSGAPAVVAKVVCNGEENTSADDGVVADGVAGAGAAATSGVGVDLEQVVMRKILELADRLSASGRFLEAAQLNFVVCKLRDKILRSSSSHTGIASVALSQTALVLVADDVECVARELLITGFIPESRATTALADEIAEYGCEASPQL